jgi:CheY-like chemotaxis protein
VEDNEDHAELVKRSLRTHRIMNSIHHVTDGEEALDFLFKKGKYEIDNHEHPNLILLDLRLPKLDGIGVLKKIKADPELKMIPVVVLTTSSSHADVGDAYTNYVNSYLVKPVDFSKFSKMMEELGYYWMGWNENPLDD